MEAYQKTLNKHYGTKTSPTTSKKEGISKAPKPFRIFSGPNEGTYTAYLISTVYKGEKMFEKTEYISSYLTKFVFSFFGSPNNLRPVTDTSNAKYEDTLDYDAANKTFRVTRVFRDTGARKVMPVFVGKLSTPLVPGSIKIKSVFSGANKKKTPKEEPESDDIDYEVIYRDDASQ